jgi:hypothetical protein
VTLTNCTFNRNSATEGGGIYNVDESYLIATNCIFWDNGNEIYNTSTSNPVITYSDIEGGGYPGEGNINSDPCFVNASNGDCHLKLISPCINAGDPNGNYTGQTDIDGDERVIAGRVDMGADEAIITVHNVTRNLWYGYIQQAINGANAGDKIEVGPGTYYENINFGGKNITLTSLDPNSPSVVATTIIDGNNAGSVVTFSGSETSSCKLLGFTITGGLSTSGGGVNGHGASAQISRCVFVDNHASGSYPAGGAVYNFKGLISNCTFTNNSATASIPYYTSGGALSNCNGTIRNCLIYGNSAFYGGGLSACLGNIINCTIANNTGNGCSGLFYCFSATITNCIIWDNTMGSCATPTYSCFAGGTGTNKGSNPLFVDASHGNYHIASGSPCIDADNGNVAPSTDIDGHSRYDDPYTTNTGIGTPNYADIGSFEYTGN